MTDPVFYFAYGSNMDPARFRARVGPERSWRRATLPDHRLRFAASVRSEGGGGAVVDAAPGEVVHGVLFEISPDQLAAMDRVEFDPTRDVHGIGRRWTRRVETEDGPVDAELYTVEDDGGWCAPSEVYLGHIVRGYRESGYERDVVEGLERTARARTRM